MSFYALGSSLDIDTLILSATVGLLLLALWLVGFSYFAANSQIVDIFLQASSIGRRTLTAAEAIAGKVVPLITTGTTGVANLVMKAASLTEQLTVVLAGKITSALTMILGILENVAGIVGDKLLSFGGYVGNQMKQLLISALNAAETAAKAFLQIFFNAVKGLFIPLI